MTEQKIRVLIVDDDEIQREGLAELLQRKEGFIVEQASDGDTAMSLIREADGAYDLVVTDQVFPTKKDGVALTRSIKEEFPMIAVIVFSGENEYEGLDALQAGAFRYITKPFDLPELVNIIHEITDKRQSERDIVGKLGDLIKSLSGQTVQELQETLREVVEVACSLVDADCAVLYPYDTYRDEFYGDDESVIKINLLHDFTVTDKPRTQGMAQRIREEGLVVVNNVEDLEEKYRGQILKREGIRSFVGVSLRTAKGAGGGEFGVLYLNFRQYHNFTREELDIIRIFSDLVARQYELAYARALAREQSILVEASKKIGKHNQIDDILEVTFQQAFNLVGKTTGFVLNVKRLEGAKPGYRLEIIDAKGVTEDEIEKFNDRPVTASSGSFGWVVETGKVFESKDTKSGLENGRIVDVGLPITNQVINIPLVCEKDVVGILVLDIVPTQRVKNSLRALVDIARIALGRVRSQDKSAQELQALRKIVQYIGEAEDPLPVILEEAIELFDADYGSFALVTPETETLIFRAIRAEQGLLTDEQIPEMWKQQVWDTGITGWVARNNKPFRTANVEEEEAADIYQPWHKEAKSELAVPLHGTHGAVIGVLNLESVRTDAFTIAEEQLCQSLADATAAVVEKDKLFQAMQRLNQSLEKMHQTVALADVDEVLASVTKSVSTVLGTASSCNIALLDQEGKKFDKIYAAGPNKDSVARLPRAHGGTGTYVLGTEQALYYNNVSIPPDGSPYLQEPWDWIESFAAIPLKRPERIVGVMFINLAETFLFSQDIQIVLELFAGQAAIAIENAELYQSNKEAQIRTEQIIEKSPIGMFVLNKDHRVTHWNEALERLTNYTALEMTGTRNQWKPFYEDKRSVMADLVVDGLSEEQMAVHYEGMNYQPRKTKTLDVAFEVEGLFPKLGNKWLHFTASPLKDAAGNMVGAIETIWDITERKQDEQRLIKLQEITQAIAEETTDLDAVLRLIVRSVELISPDTMCVIRLYDSCSKEFGRRIATEGLPQEVEYEPRPNGTSKYVMVNKEPFYTPSIDFDLPEPYNQPAIRKELKDMDIVVLGTLPLIAKEEIVGVMYVYWTSPQNLSENDKGILESFAEQAAIVINNAKLYRNLQRRRDEMALLNEAVKAFNSTLNPNKVLAEVIGGVGRLLGAKAASVWLVEPDTDEIVCYQATGFQKQSVKGYRMSVNEGLVGWVLRTHKSEYLADARSDERHFKDVDSQTGLETRSILAVPLKVKQDVIGVLEVVDTKKDRFNEQALHLLESLSSSAAIAIESAKLFSDLESLNDRLQHKVRNLKALSIIGQRLTSGVQLSEQDILALIDEQASAIMDTQNMYIALYNAQTDYVRFPLMRVNGESQEVTPRSGGHGRTEWIIENKEPIFISTKAESKAWYKESGREEYIGQAFASWIGVPMVAGEEVIGVIAAYHEEAEHLYSEDDLEILRLMADQAAIALKSAQQLDIMRSLAVDLSAGTLDV